jgi:heterotetrameric sarcosine oxidase delta subunit
MIIINCPHCGPRDHAEFTYIGDATVKRPAFAGEHDDKTWYEFVYIRDNPRGAHLEYWQHNAGCRAYVKVLRNTASHEIMQVGLPADDMGKPGGQS